MNTRRVSPRALALFAAALSVCSPALQASLVYYLPFDNGTSASLDNSGTAGGTATGVGSSYGIVGAPTASSSIVKLGSYAELYTTNASNTVYGGATLLPDSTTNFRLNNNASQMTISTWVYWNGVAGTNTRYGIANLFPSNNGSGWSFYIDNTGKLSYAFVTDAGASRSRTTTNTVITAGGWINVTLVVDTSYTNNSSVLIYVNGVLQTLTGSALTTAVTLNNTGDIAVGVMNHTSGAGGSFALNGYLDDYAMWDTTLSAAKIKAINTAPAQLSGYGAGTMNTLFNTYDAQGSSIIGTLTWSYGGGFDVSGRTLGDTWQGSDGKYYLWLEGSSGSALGLIGVTSNIPEPGSTGLLMGAGLLTFVAFRRTLREAR